MARLVLILALCLPALAARAEEVDLELALAVDTSRSMDVDELMLQREGYARALEHPAFTSRLSSGPLGRIAVTYFDWGAAGLSDVILPWTVLETEEDAFAAAAVLRGAPVKNLSGTSIAGAILKGVSLIEENGYEGLRRVIDVSGDGPNNDGPPVTEARNLAGLLGIEVNGLPIMLKRPGGPYNITDLDIYYEDCVITGPAAFVVPVHEPDRFVQAIARKLVLEVAGAMPEGRARLRRVAATDCLIGEKLRRSRNRYLEP